MYFSQDTPTTQLVIGKLFLSQPIKRKKVVANMLQDVRAIKANSSTSSYQQQFQQQVDNNFVDPSRMSLADLAMLPSCLSQLQNHCFNLYPNQQQNLIKTEKAFIFGGSEPLDYIYIFKNNGDEANNIPAHWHYVGLGLSDIHNYSLLYFNDLLLRQQYPSYAHTMQALEPIYPLPIHGPELNDERLSGFGFELTFRIKCNSLDDWNQNKPPKWPCNIMQALAKYVFQSKNVFSVGDHVAWQVPLSASTFNKNEDTNINEIDDDRDSIIEHMLMTLDPQLKSSKTSLGLVKFIQLVGVTQDELQAAREWNVKGILDIMRENSETGGEYLITDMSRGANIFQLNPDYRDRVDDSIKEAGSDMTIISAKHKYSSRKPIWYIAVEKQQQSTSSYDYNNHNNTNSEDDLEPPIESQQLLQDQHQEQQNDQDYDNNYAGHSLVGGVERGNLLNMPKVDRSTANNDDDIPMRCSSRMSYESESALKIENAELAENRLYDQIYILLSLESAKLLPVALSGRLAHKKAFTYKTSKGDLCTTLIPQGSGVESLVSPERPYVRKGPWLQIYISDELRSSMMSKIKEDFNRNLNENSLILPKNYAWPEHKLYITVVRDEKDISDTD